MPFLDKPIRGTPFSECLYRRRALRAGVSGRAVAAADPASTIQPDADMVVVDVVVADARHHPIHNLTAADFKLFENGQAQNINTFEEHHSWDAAAPLPQAPSLPPGTFTNYTTAPAKGALDILLLDTLNTPMSAQAGVRSQILSYLEEARPGTRMAIFGLASRLILLQGFTSKPALLSDLLNAKNGLPEGAVAMTDQVEGINPAADDSQTGTARNDSEAMGNDPDASQLIANVQQFEAESQSFLLQTRARYTLDALNQLARFLSKLPGRKNLIWFSGSFPINILPDGSLKILSAMLPHPRMSFARPQNFCPEARSRFIPSTLAAFWPRPS